MNAPPQAPEPPHVRLSFSRSSLLWHVHLVGHLGGEPDELLSSSLHYDLMKADAVMFADRRNLPLVEAPLPAAPQDNHDLPEHDVAVVVFTKVRAVDFADAASIAERAVAGAVRNIMLTVFGTNSQPYGEIVFRDLRRNFRVPVVVTEVRELGMAGGDSYVRVAPTRKAYRAFEERYPACPHCGARDGHSPAPHSEDCPQIGEDR